MAAAARRAWIAGVTGGIGSGKTAFSRRLAGRSGHLVDADRIAARLTDSDRTVRKKLAEVFGERIFKASGRLNRGLVASIVFDSPAALRALNRIMWPALVRAIRAEIRRLHRQSPGTPLILDMAVLCETGCDRLCDTVVTVHAPMQLRFRRLRESRGWDDGHIRLRMAAQMSDKDRMERSDFIVDNDGTPAELGGKARDFRQLLNSAFPGKPVSNPVRTEKDR
ncbi:dephospho-CoA kinase [bacterium]|nr:dephospho-CoA kinase [bacterium]